ncbi:MAG: hypothetical protein U0236_11010 [Nitrospira sp.]
MGVQMLLNASSDVLKAQPKRNETEETYATRNGWVTKLRQKNLEPHAVMEAKIQGDKSLSEQGKREKLRTLAETQTLPGLPWIARVHSAQMKEHEGFRTRFFTLVPDIQNNEALRFMILKEIRDREYTGDRNARNARFLKAGLDDEVLVLSAALEYRGPAFIDSEVRERVLLARAQRLQPERFEAYQQNQLLLEWIQMLRDWCASWLLELGVPPTVIDRTLETELATSLKTGDPSFRTKMEADLRARLGEASWPETQEQAEARTKREQAQRGQAVVVG